MNNNDFQWIDDIVPDKDVWYLHDKQYDIWYRLRYRHDLSGLNDVFVAEEDYREQGIIKGMKYDFYYGTMGLHIEEGSLIREHEYMDKGTH